MALTATSNGFFSRHRWLVWAAGIIVAVLLLASFMSRDDAIPVRAATVDRSSIRSVISTNGKVEPVQSFEAHAPVGTTIKKLLVKEGDHVKRGQLLAQLDDADASSQAAHALAQVRSSQADVSAQRSGGNREEVLTLEAQLVKSRNERDTARRNLEALKRLQQQGAASPGEVKQAEDQLGAAEADLTLVQQKQKDRYSQPEIARVDAQTAEAQSAYAAAENILRQLNIRAPLMASSIPCPSIRALMSMPATWCCKRPIFRKFWCAPTWTNPTWDDWHADRELISSGTPSRDEPGRVR